MSILFPLLLVPVYDATNGDELIFYSVVAGILSGSVAGDHMSPISDTTVLSALASECGLMDHVNTQAPYAAVAIIVSVLVGTIPIGRDAWPNIVGILLGFVIIALFVYFFCKPIISPTGAWDPITALYIKVTKNETLEQLTHDTIRAANGEDLSTPIENKKLEEDTPDLELEKKRLEDDNDLSEEDLQKQAAGSTDEEVHADA
jgi:Na+/H+ antiporter family